MPVEARGPDGQMVRFPDGTPPARIDAVMSSIYTPVKAAPPAARPKTSGVGAFMRGAFDTATGGLIDEGVAALDTVFGRNAGSKTALEAGSFRQAFDNNVRNQRALASSDEANHGGARLTGQIAGGFAVPMGRATTLAQMAGQGAKFGAVYGAGSAEGGVRERATGAAVGAATGAAAGYAGGKVVEKGGQYLARSRAARVVAGQRKAEAVANFDAATGMGIDLPASAVGGKSVRVADQTLSNMPFSATTMDNSRRAVMEQTEAAADNLAGRYGSARTAEDTGEALQEGARKWIGKFEDTTGKLYDAIPINGASPASLGSTRAALDELTAGLPSNPDLSALLKDGKLEGFKSALSGKGLSWNDLKAFRTYIGQKVGQANFGEGTSSAQLRRLYAGLSADMEATAAARGPKALRAFMRANDTYAQGQMRIEKALVDILGKDGNKAPEAAAGVASRIAKTGVVGDIRKLRAIRSSMPREEWGEVAGGIIRRMGEPGEKTGEFSVSTFTNNFEKLSPEAKGLIFGKEGAEARKALEQFAGVAKTLRETERLANASNTAGQINTALTGGSIGGIIVSAFVNPASLLASIPAALSPYVAARAMTNPKFVRWYVGTLRAAQATAQRNPQAVAGIVQKRVGQLPGILGAQSEIAREIARGMSAAANNNVPAAGVRAVASEPEEGDR